MKNNCQRLFNRVPVSSSNFEQAFILETTKYFKNLYKTLNVKTSEGALTGKESKIEEAESYETLSVVCAEVASCKLSEKGLFCKLLIFPKNLLRQNYFSRIFASDPPREYEEQLIYRTLTFSEHNSRTIMFLECNSEVALEVTIHIIEQILYRISLVTYFRLYT